MMRGTTPTIEFVLPFTATIFKKVYITFSQSDVEKFTLTNDNVLIAEDKLICELSQTNTLALDSGCKVEIQIRGLTIDNKAVASKPIVTWVDRILKDGEI